MNDIAENIVLSAEGINFGFSQNYSILKGIDLSLNKAVITGLIGKSGEGKSVLARILAGLPIGEKQFHLSGKLYYHSEKSKVDLMTLSEKELSDYRGHKISIVFQDPYSSFDPLVSCGKQLKEVIVNNLGINSEEAYKKAREYIKEFDLDERVLNSYPHQVSGGELQRMAIAIAMVSEPEVLIADEPVTNLDSVNKKQILDLLKRFKTDKNLSVLYISHDINSVRYIADEVFLMSNGELENVDMQSLTEGINPEGKYRNVGSSQQYDECILELRGVQKSFKKNGLLSLFKAKKAKKALDDVGFRLGKNQVLGIIGESGSGKTTIARILTGLETYDEGKYFLNGKEKNLNDNKSIKEIRQNIQMVFQNPVNSLNYLVKNRTLIKEAFEVISGKSGTIDLNKAISLLFKELDLDVDILDRYPGQISGGEAQRLAIARVLVLNPKVVIFDEAFSSLDQQTKSIIYKKLFQLQDEYKFSYIFITHDIKSIKSVCDYMIVMQNGKIVDQGEPDQIYINPKSEYTSKLINNLI